MSLIVSDGEFDGMKSLKKGVSGGVVASIALALLSCFHGLTPEQQQAGVIVSIVGIEALRNFFKKKFPRILNWL